MTSLTLKKRVIVESPYAGDLEKNLRYLEDCIRDCIGRGEAPFASHGFYTQWLDDNEESERKLGIVCGFSWTPAADLVAFYTDLGISEGMKLGLAHAHTLGVKIELRSLDHWVSSSPNGNSVS